MAERRAGLGRGLGELFQRTDVDARPHPVDEHVIVGRRKEQDSSAPTQGPGQWVDQDPVTDDKQVTANVPSHVAQEHAATEAATASNQSSGRRTTDLQGTGEESPDGVPVPEVTSREGDSMITSEVPSTVEDSSTVEAGAAKPEAPADDHDHEGLVDPANGYYADIPISRIVPNPRQPRTVFDEDALDELVESIREIGLLQPIVVRDTGQETFELVMGERRWRATKAAGLETIPAIVRRTDDDDMLRDALLENIHRAQLNPLEEAAAYQQLIDDFACTQQELGERIKRSRSQIANTLRLLNLPPTIQRRVAAGVLSAGHARALLGLSDPLAQEQLAQRIVAEGLSVRATEEVVALGGGEGRRPQRRGVRQRDPRLEEISVELGNYLDTRVEVTQGRKKGKIVVEYASQDDLARILELLRS